MELNDIEYTLLDDTNLSKRCSRVFNIVITLYQLIIIINTLFSEGNSWSDTL